MSDGIPYCADYKHGDTRACTPDCLDFRPATPADLPTPEPTELTVLEGSTWKNKKNGRLYTIIHGDGTNSTNAQDGQVMVTYRRHPTEVPDGGRWYHREIREFVQKFELIEEES